MTTSSTKSGGVAKVIRSITLVTAAGILVGFVLVPPKATTAQGKKAADHAKHHAWHHAMAKIPHPNKTGTFEATYPNKEWREVPRSKIVPNRHPMMPRRPGPRPLNVGNGNNICAQAPTGVISSATGVFDSANVTSLTGQVNGKGPQVANAYTIQLNTNFFPSTFPGAPAGCQGWEQFVFQNDGGTTTDSYVYIQYWLIGFGTTSPGAGWIQGGTGSSNWFRNSTNFSVVPTQAITNLAHLRMTGTVGATSDSWFFSTGDKMYSGTGDNSVNASTGWNIAEFCIVGDGSSGQANFNTGASIVSRTEIDYGGNDPPLCVVAGFTGETNNLSFPATPPLASQPGPAVIVTESTSGGMTANCATATSVGDTHLTTFHGLLYDFQASGDFVLAHVDQNFHVHTRQVSGAPNWPDASVNHAVAMRMGKHTIAISVGAKRLVIDGKTTELADGKSDHLADGVDITRRGNVYYVTDKNGHSVRATLYLTDKMNWMDVMVGLCQCCAKTKATGLLANHNGDVHKIATRDGKVLSNPFVFEDLYRHYGDSWRVPPKDSLLSVFGNVAGANPKQPFHAVHLDKQLHAQLHAVAKKTGVTHDAHIDAAILDMAVLGHEKAAQVFVDHHHPVAVGKHLPAK